MTGKTEKEEKIVSIQDIIWQNRKPQVTLTSSQQGTIEYKDSEGNWQSFINGTELENGTTLTVRVKLPTGETTKEEQIEIIDKIKPTEFEIEVLNESVQAKAVTVSLKTEPQDNETGLREDYTYVAETNSNKIEKINILETTYKIEGLEPETNYTVYVIAYDNAGNYRESNKIKIRTKEIGTPTVDTPNNESTIREGNELPFTWAQLSEISGIIENTLKDNNPNNDITNDTNEFTLNYDGEDYTIGVGDWKKVTYEDNEYTVRIMGFNHDILAGQNILNEDGTLKEEYLDTTNSDNQISEESYNRLNKAGISFEFTGCIMTSNMRQPGDKSSYGNNTGGWANRILRTTLNGEGEGEERTNGIIDSLTEINQYVKRVTKAYGATNSSSVLSYTEDDLWLLSGFEIWGEKVKTYNSTKCMDGIQYKFYKNAVTTVSKNTQVVKDLDGSATNWWLRSIYPNNINPFLCVHTNGSLWSSTAPYARGVAPNFCI